MNLSRDFHDYEFACRGSGKLILHPGFIDRLQSVRDDLAEVMAVRSGCRSQAYNSMVGGHPRSLHICDVPQHKGQAGTLAVDIGTPDMAFRGRLFAAAWARGFSIGWGSSFLHLDLRIFVGLPQTCFNY